MDESIMKPNDVSEKKGPRNGEQKENEHSAKDQFNEKIPSQRPRKDVAEGQEEGYYESTNRVNTPLQLSNGNHDVMTKHVQTDLDLHITDTTNPNQMRPPISNLKPTIHTVFPTLVDQGKNQNGNWDKYLKYRKISSNNTAAGSVNDMLLNQHIQSKPPHTTSLTASLPTEHASSYYTTPTAHSLTRQQLPPLLSGSSGLQQDQQQLRRSGGAQLPMPQTIAQQLLGIGGALGTAPSAATASLANRALYDVFPNAFNRDSSSRALLEGGLPSHPSALMNLQQQKHESTNGYFRQQNHSMNMVEQRRIYQLEEIVRRQAALKLDLASHNLQLPPYQRGIEQQRLVNLPNMINPSVSAIDQDVHNRGTMHQYKNRNHYSDISRADFTSNEEMRKSSKRQRIEDEQVLSCSGQIHLAHHHNHHRQFPAGGLSIPAHGMIDNTPLIFTNQALTQHRGHATREAPKTTLKSRVFKTFQERFDDLLNYKVAHGHCNVPRRYGPDKSLGVWCNNIRYSYKQIQEGKQPHNSISVDDIRRLDEIGFQWKLKVNAS